jgi:hypothetical protein
LLFVCLLIQVFDWKSHQLDAQWEFFVQYAPFDAGYEQVKLTSSQYNPFAHCWSDESKKNKKQKYKRNKK